MMVKGGKKEFCGSVGPSCLLMRGAEFRFSSYHGSRTLARCRLSGLFFSVAFFNMIVACSACKVIFRVSKSGAGHASKSFSNNRTQTTSFRNVASPEPKYAATPGTSSIRLS
jgi:hypothetical protein